MPWMIQELDKQGPKAGICIQFAYQAKTFLRVEDDADLIPFNIWFI